MGVRGRTFNEALPDPDSTGGQWQTWRGHGWAVLRSPGGIVINAPGFPATRAALTAAQATAHADEARRFALALDAAAAADGPRLEAVKP